VQPVAQVRGVGRGHGLVRPRRRPTAAGTTATATCDETHAPPLAS
jgi:hypothetical protein